MRFLKSVKYIPYFFATYIFTGCTSQHKLTAGEGYINVTGGKVWYRIVGEGKKAPVLLLHGGPGGSSYLLYPFKALSADRPVIFLDQLGSGKSDRITDTSMMTIENYVEELEQFRKELHLKKYFLYGHSWGTMLGMDYYLKYPKGIKGIIFNSPLFSTDRWIKDADTLITTLPEDVQSAIRKNEKSKTYNDPEYVRATTVFYHHFNRLATLSAADRDSSKGMFGKNVYDYMWGPSEFTSTGNLKNYDRLKYLSSIKVPVLFICGEFDEARPVTVRYYQSLVPHSKFLEIPNAAHSTMMDAPQENVKAVRDFINEIDKK